MATVISIPEKMMETSEKDWENQTETIAIVQYTITVNPSFFRSSVTIDYDSGAVEERVTRTSLDGEPNSVIFKRVSSIAPKQNSKFPAIFDFKMHELSKKMSDSFLPEHSFTVGLFLDCLLMLACSVPQTLYMFGYANLSRDYLNLWILFIGFACFRELVMAPIRNHRTFNSLIKDLDRSYSTLGDILETDNQVKLKWYPNYCCYLLSDEYSVLLTLEKRI